MKLSLAFFCSLIISVSAFAYQDGIYDCSVDAFTKSTVVVKTVNLSSDVQLPFIEYSFYRGGITHLIKGLGTVNLQEVERRDKVTKERYKETTEVLVLGDHEVASFNSENSVSSNCTKR